MTGFYLRDTHDASVFAVTLVIVAASLFSSVTASAQEVFYRVHSEEYKLIKPHLIDYPNGFLIVSTAKGVAMPHIQTQSASKAVLEGVSVNLSDDLETITVDDVENSKLMYDLILPHGSSYINLQYRHEKGNYQLYNEGKNEFYSAPETNGAVDKSFIIRYNAANDGLLEIKTPEKNSKVYHITYGYGTTSTSPTERFRFRDDITDNTLSIYHRDCFNIHFTDPDKRVEDGRVGISLDLTGNGIAVTTLLKYVINDGEDVGISQLLESPDQEEIRAAGSGLSVTSFSLPVGGGGNTIWAMPVMVDSDGAYPVGRIFKGDFAEIPTGIDTVGLDAESQDPVYFDLHGRIVTPPLQRGVYIRKSGSNVVKVLVQ